MDTTISHNIETHPLGIRANLIDGIVIDRQIGSGATSTVYLGVEADDPRKRYAIKFLSPFLGMQEAARRRWAREAELVLQLDHPNIVRGFRHGVVDNRPYLIMEFLQGESLMDRLKRLGKLPEDEVFHIARSVLAALQAANIKGIIHRDIKPANIILLNDNTVKVMDFGLAKSTDDMSLTTTGMIVGTPIYVSPEQATGENIITIQADLYSLGVTLFHLACGQPPFSALNTSLLLTKKITDDVPDIRLFDRSISGKLAHLVDRLCQRNRLERVKTPDEGLDLLNRLESGELTTSEIIPEPKSALAPFRVAPIEQVSGTVLRTVVGDQDLNAKPVFLQPNEVLFYEDDDSRECYILMSGKIEILKSARAIAEISEPGSYIGEMSPLNSQPRTATVVARDDTVLLRIEEDEFNEFFHRHPDMALLLARTLAQRLEKTTNKLNEVNSRIAVLGHHLQEMNTALKGA